MFLRVNLCPGLRAFFFLAGFFPLLLSPVTFPRFDEYQLILNNSKSNLFYPPLFPQTPPILHAKHLGMLLSWQSSLPPFIQGKKPLPVPSTVPDPDVGQSWAKLPEPWLKTLLQKALFWTRYLCLERMLVKQNPTSVPLPSAGLEACRPWSKLWDLLPHSSSWGGLVLFSRDECQAPVALKELQCLMGQIVYNKSRLWN